MRPVWGSPATRSASTSKRTRSGAKRWGSAARRPSTRVVTGRERWTTWPGGGGSGAARMAPAAPTPTINSPAARACRPRTSRLAPHARATMSIGQVMCAGTHGVTAMPKAKARAIGTRGTRSHGMSLGDGDELTQALELGRADPLHPAQVLYRCEGSDRFATFDDADCER